MGVNMFFWQTIRCLLQKYTKLFPNSYDNSVFVTDGQSAD